MENEAKSVSISSLAVAAALLTETEDGTRYICLMDSSVLLDHSKVENPNVAFVLKVDATDEFKWGILRDKDEFEQLQSNLVTYMETSLQVDDLFTQLFK